MAKLDALFEAYRPVTKEKLWENLKYFLEAVMPTCHETGIKMAIHQDDPPWDIFGLPRLLCDKDSIGRLLKMVDDEYNCLCLCSGSLGACDILINGAGGNNPRATTDNEYQHEAAEGQKTFFDLDAGGVDFVFKLNFQGTLIPTQVFAKDMVERKSGCILNISSMNAYIPLTKIPAYSAAKAGVSNFTQWLATHFAGTGIRCNAIAPGFLVSNQNRALLFNQDGTVA